MSDARARKDIGNPWTVTRDTYILNIRRNHAAKRRPLNTTDYLDISADEADDLVAALSAVLGSRYWTNDGGLAAVLEQRIAAWIRDHVQYHLGADGVLLEAIADGILEGLYNQASAKVAGHDYVFEMECGVCDGKGEPVDGGRCGVCDRGSVRVRRRHVPSWAGPGVAG